MEDEGLRWWSMKVRMFHWPVRESLLEAHVPQPVSLTTRRLAERPSGRIWVCFLT
jgi:hypothetical protein